MVGWLDDWTPAGKRRSTTSPSGAPSTKPSASSKPSNSTYVPPLPLPPPLLRQAPHIAYHELTATRPRRAAGTIRRGLSRQLDRGRAHHQGGPHRQARVLRGRRRRRGCCACCEARARGVSVCGASLGRGLSVNGRTDRSFDARVYVHTVSLGVAIPRSFSIYTHMLACMPCSQNRGGSTERTMTTMTMMVNK